MCSIKKEEGEGHVGDFNTWKNVCPSISEVHGSINHEENDNYSTNDFDEKPIQDAYLDSQSAIQEKPDVRVDNQLEVQSTSEGVEQYLVKPEFVHFGELNIKIEDEERDPPTTVESQNEVNSPLKPYVKSEPITLESDEDIPLNELQKSESFEDTVIKEESSAETGFSIQEEVSVKSEDKISDPSPCKSTVGQIKKRHRPSNKTAPRNGVSQRIVNLSRFYQTQPSVFKCHHCTFQTHRKGYISRHVLVHMNNKLDDTIWNQCPECPFKTKNRRYLMNGHMLFHNKDVPMNKSPNFSRLYQTKPSVFKCFHCTFQTHRKMYISRHVLMHMEKNLKCSHCSFKTRDKGIFKQHELIHVPTEEAKLYKCPECSFTSIRKGNAVKHMEIHKKPQQRQLIDVPKDEANLYKCPECSYTSVRKGNVVQHMNIHKRPDDAVWYQCSDCPYKTKHGRLLSKHNLIHENGAPMFKCTLCSYESFRKGDLTQHIQAVHNPDDIQLIHCQEEGCSFKTHYKKYLSRHITLRHDPNGDNGRKHKKLNDSIWYQCPECPYKTQRKQNLTHTHMIIHKKDAPMHKCTLCAYESVRKSNLTKHIQCVHRPKDIPLIHCQEEGCSFKTHHKRYLSCHIKMVHECKKIFKCSKCYFQTKYSVKFKVHEFQHKDQNK